MQRQNWLLLLIIGLVIASIVILIKLPLQLGLDLRGGSQLTIQVKPTETVTTIQPNDLKAVQNVIENRVNALGVSESLVQTVDSKNQVIVQLPGVTNPKEAERNLNVQAQLEFRQQKHKCSGPIRISSAKTRYRRRIPGWIFNFSTKKSGISRPQSRE